MNLSKLLKLNGHAVQIALETRMLHPVLVECRRHGGTRLLPLSNVSLQLPDVAFQLFTSILLCLHTCASLLVIPYLPLKDLCELETHVWLRVRACVAVRWLKVSGPSWGVCLLSDLIGRNLGLVPSPCLRWPLRHDCTGHGVEKSLVLK
jgi:hypothetical protein